MRRRVVNVRANRNNPQWIHGRTASIIMPFDVFHAHSAAHPWNLKNVFRVIEQILVLSDQLLVALEVNRINLKYTVKQCYVFGYYIEHNLTWKVSVYTSSNLTWMSDSVRELPHIYRCLPRISSHLSKVSYKFFTACKRKIISVSAVSTSIICSLDMEAVGPVPPHKGLAS